MATYNIATDTARILYETFAANDGGTLAGLLSDTRWVEPAGLPYGGTHIGLAAIIGNVFGPVLDDIPDFIAKPDEILSIGDDRALALGRYRGTGSAGPLDVPFAHLITVADRRIAEFVVFTDTHLYRQALGG